MATQQRFMPPTLAPDLLKKQYQMQQNQRYAQSLMEQGAGQPQGQMVGNHYVAPSITQHLANALKTYTGRRIMDDAPEQMADLQQAQQAQDMQRFSSLYGGGGQGSGGQGAMSPQDMQREFMVAQLMGMDKYAAERMKWNAPTNEQKNLGFLPENVRNQAIMAPFVNEMNQDGVQNVLGQNGQVQAFAVPGYSDIQAQNAGAVAGAQAGAQAKYRFVDVPDGQGGTFKMREDQASAALGGLGAGQGTGQPIAPFQTDAPPAGSGLGVQLPETVVEARQELPKVAEQATQMISSIDGILQHPGLEGAVGLQWGAAFVPGTKERDFVARSDQLQGQAFLQAFESLKGGGQITEIEGKAATDAIGRLSRAQSEEAYKESLNELRGILVKARNRAYEKARMPMPSQPTGSASATGDRSSQLDQILGF